MPQHSRALVVLLVALAVSQSAEGARAKTAPAPPPPPPPPPSLLDAIKAVAVSAVAKLPSRAACLEACLKISGAALQLASSAASASHKAAAALTSQLDTVMRASPYKAPVAMASRLVERLQKPSWATPLAVVALYCGFLVLLMTRSQRYAGGKPYARAALCTAFVNWLSFSFMVNSIATVFVFLVTVLSLVASHPLTTLSLALAANGNELRRFSAYLPARRKRATFASASATDSELAQPPRAVGAAPAAAAAPAPAARISSTATPDASKVKPTTPVPGGAKTPPAVAVRK